MLLDNSIYSICAGTDTRGKYTLCLNFTHAIPYIWSDNDFGLLKVAIEWLLDNGIDLTRDPEVQYNNYVSLIKTFWSDYLHLLCPRSVWLVTIERLRNLKPNKIRSSKRDYSEL